MNNKYDICISNKAIDSNICRLTNQIWKLIPMRENNEDWKKQLETVIIEVAGLEEIFLSTPLLLQLLAKLEGLNKIPVDFVNYRKTIFDAIEIIQQFKESIQ